MPDDIDRPQAYTGSRGHGESCELRIGLGDRLAARAGYASQLALGCYRTRPPRVPIVDALTLSGQRVNHVSVARRHRDWHSDCERIASSRS